MFRSLPRSAREGGIYLIAGTLSRSVSLILLPLYARFLDGTEVGAFGIITALVLFLQILTIGGFDSAAGRWYFYTPEPKARSVAFSTWAFNQLAISSFFCVLIFLTARPLATGLTGDADRFTNSVRLAGLVLVVATMPNILYNWYRLARRPVAASLTAVGTAVSTVVMTLLFIVVLDNGTAGAFQAQVVSGVIMSVLAIALMRQAANPLRMDRGLWRQMMVYALPLIPGGAAFWVISVADRFLLRAQSSIEEVGRYHVIATAASGLALLTYAFQQTWGPIALGMKDEPRAHAVYRKAFLGYVVLGGALVVFVAATGTIILEVLGGPDYSGLTAALTVLTASVVVTGGLAIVTIGSAIVGTSRPTFEAAMAAATVNIIGNIILIPRYGSLGASWATLGSMVVLVGVGMHRSERHLLIRYPVRRGIVIGGLFGAIAGLLVWLDDQVGGSTQVMAVGTLVLMTAGLTVVMVRSTLRQDLA